MNIIKSILAYTVMAAVVLALAAALSHQSHKAAAIEQSSGVLAKEYTRKVEELTKQHEAAVSALNARIVATNTHASRLQQQLRRQEKASATSTNPIQGPIMQSYVLRRALATAARLAAEADRCRAGE